MGYPGNQGRFRAGGRTSGSVASRPLALLLPLPLDLLSDEPLLLLQLPGALLSEPGDLEETESGALATNKAANCASPRSDRHLCY